MKLSAADQQLLYELCNNGDVPDYWRWLRLVWRGHSFGHSWGILKVL